MVFMSELLTVFGFSIIFIATSLGASIVFLFKNNVSDKFNALFLGLAAGIMVAASVWSLLLPSIEGAREDYGALAFIPAVVGFIVGGFFMVFLDILVPNFTHGRAENDNACALFKPIKMFFAMTVHNIPEGLAVGFAFGGAAALGTEGAYIPALGLAVGIAIQNFPEGAAVSLPLSRVIGGRFKSFSIGVLSGAVEPVAAVVGYFLASLLIKAQPWFLAFAAGAMIFVVAEDVIPDAKTENSHLGTWGVMAGFAVMMLLDVALG